MTAKITKLSLEQAQGLSKLLADAREFVDIDLTLTSFVIRDAIAYVAAIDPEAAIMTPLVNWYELVAEFDFNDPGNYSLSDPYLIIHGQLALDLGYLNASS